MLKPINSKGYRYYSKILLDALKTRSGGYCECCGVDVSLQKHHIYEFSKGGPTTLDNLILFCPTCHIQLPKILTMSQQIELQTWHQNNIKKRRSINHQLSNPINEFIIGGNTFNNCQIILQIG